MAWLNLNEIKSEIYEGVFYFESGIILIYKQFEEIASQVFFRSFSKVSSS